MQYTILHEDCFHRLDKVLSQKLELSRTQLQRWMEQGCVLCEGKPVSAKHPLKVGQVFEINVPEAIPDTLMPEARDLDVLFEDKHLLVLNKQAGEVVHPGAGVREGTLVSALLHHCKGKLSGIGGVERPGIVHRLDKETSGVLVVAKNDETHRNLSAQFEARETHKVYKALVNQSPRMQAGSWQWPIGRHPMQRQKMKAFVRPLSEDHQARTAHTEFEIEKKWSTIASQLRLILHTGRTHQIRVHVATAGCSVIGDSTYGTQPEWIKDAGIKRHMLHAYQLGFTHRGKWVEFEAPLPDDFLQCQAYLDNHADELRKKISTSR